MGVVKSTVAVSPPRRQVTSREVRIREFALALSRSLADDVFDDELADALEELLGEPHQRGAAAPALARAGALGRFAFLAPHRPVENTPPSLPPSDLHRLRDRLRRTTRQLLQVVPSRVSPYPTEELRRLLALRDVEPAPDQILAHLRLWALAILTILDLMEGDPR
ncbi:hypothetical protein [Streptomyces cinereoruber]|uniref:hypothetical protein n=1 Tax=Streptomyces cinereoruber TaxID=67260 RepID=UPI003624B52A